MASPTCAEEAACGHPLPDEELTRQVCDAMSACEATWDRCDDGNFAVWLGWLRHDVKRARMECLELPTCGERMGCLGAWLLAFDTREG